MLGTIFCNYKTVFAEESTNAEESEVQKASTSISITPVSKILKLEPSTEYKDSFTVTNNGSETMEFEVYASPYSFTYSENDLVTTVLFKNSSANKEFYTCLFSRYNPLFHKLYFFWEHRSC